MEDPKMWLMAHLIVNQHGDAAFFFAAQHADKERANGDHAAAAIWTRLLGVIETIQRQKSPSSEVQH
jgi:hypothetical protein